MLDSGKEAGTVVEVHCSTERQNRARKKKEEKNSAKLHELWPGIIIRNYTVT